MKSVKTVFCDINIILDIFLKREPFYTPAARFFSIIEEKKIHGYLSALSFPTLFYEDAVQYYSAIHVQADCLVTRNKRDYRVDPLPILTPEEFLASTEVPE